VEAVTAALAAAGGARVGLRGVLDDLNRRATVARVPAPAAAWGFRWDDEDARSGRWWPQGVTTSADHGPSEEFAGRRILLTSWYSKRVHGLHKGSRITVVDLDEPEPRYRHVLLVDLVVGAGGAIDVRPLEVHAGGIVWHGDHLHVARTWHGIATFHLDDVLRVGHLGDRDRLGVGVGTFGYRYLLPVRLTYEAGTDEGHERLRYSFLSLDRTAPEPRLVVGEYGRGGATTRLADYAIDPSSALLRLGDEQRARPRSLLPGVEGMQGATVVDGRWYVTTSAGRYRRGSLYVGRPGSFERRAGVLPVGVEDLSYWPSEDRLWSLSEYPGRRFVFAMDRARLD
jgi:hypothetical protein